MRIATHHMPLLAGVLAKNTPAIQHFRITLGGQKFLVSLSEISTPTNHGSPITSHQNDRYAGMEYEAAIDLSQAGFRYYDANSGRFSNEDPIGFNGGDTNLYRYVGNDPVSKIDPMGMETVNHVTQTIMGSGQHTIVSARLSNGAGQTEGPLGASRQGGGGGVAKSYPSGGGSVGYYPPNFGGPNSGWWKRLKEYLGLCEQMNRGLSKAPGAIDLPPGTREVIPTAEAAIGLGKLAKVKLKQKELDEARHEDPQDPAKIARLNREFEAIAAEVNSEKP